jgi:CRISPR-associated protein Cmr3
MTTIGLVLEPLDTLFFRTGRPFGAGLPGESGLPNPQNFAGALRTHLLERAGADFESMRGRLSTAEAFQAAGAGWLAGVRFRGPWLAEIRNTQSPRPFVQAPADLNIEARKPALLRPLATDLPGWQAPEAGIRPLWCKGARPDKEGPGLLSWDGLGAYLRGDDLMEHQLTPAAKLYHLEERTGITVDERTQSAAESLIYSTRALRLESGVAFYGELDLPEEQAQWFDGEQAIPWGGERHHAIVRRVSPVKWPPPPEGPKVKLLLLAPGFFSPVPWRPAAITPGTLRAAAVAGPFAVSGWDLARRGPKPARFGAGAGSVYFLEGGQTPPGRQLATGEDEMAGYGLFVKGVWKYAE